MSKSPDGIEQKVWDEADDGEKEVLKDQAARQKAHGEKVDIHETPTPSMEDMTKDILSLPGKAISGIWNDIKNWGEDMNARDQHKMTPQTQELIAKENSPEAKAERDRRTKNSQAYKDIQEKKKTALPWYKEKSRNMEDDPYQKNLNERRKEIDTEVKANEAAANDDDPFKDTKAAWQHLTDVFGEKVSALQSELEGRLGEQLTPKASETNNPFANQGEVGPDKELTLDDVKAAAGSAADDAKAVVSGIGEIGGAASSVAGNGVREGTRAAIKDMGYDPNDVGAALTSVGKGAKGLAGLFATGDSSGGNGVPDGNWNPDMSKIPGIGSLFK